MTDFSTLIRYFESYILLTEEEKKLLVSSFKMTKVKKRQFIVQPDFVAKYRNFVLEGALRGYIVGDEGQDHTIVFAIDEWWITDYYSYIFQQPATMFVVALEDSTLLQIDFEAEQFLKRSNHKFETIFRMLAEKSFAHLQRRIMSSLSHTAEERYEHFAQKYPKVIQKIPQYAIASYLGMTTEFLSKIRNKRVSKKS